MHHKKWKNQRYDSDVSEKEKVKKEGSRFWEILSMGEVKQIPDESE